MRNHNKGVSGGLDVTPRVKEDKRVQFPLAPLLCINCQKKEREIKRLKENLKSMAEVVARGDCE